MDENSQAYVDEIRAMQKELAQAESERDAARDVARTLKEIAVRTIDVDTREFLDDIATLETDHPWLKEDGQMLIEFEGARDFEFRLGSGEVFRAGGPGEQAK